MKQTPKSTCLPLLKRLVVFSSIFACLAVAFIAGTIAEIRQSEPRKPFTVAVLPDTQYYCDLNCGGTPEMYMAQVRWLVERAKDDNIKFAIHVGDIVNVADKIDQWRVADKCHTVLEEFIAFSVCRGNHDLGTSDYYNSFFGPDRFEGRDWYGGHRGTGNDDNYTFFEAAGMKFMVVSLTYQPKAESLAWANSVIRKHPDRRVILATHEYLDPTGRRPIGNQIWNEVVRKNANVFMVLCGHVCGWHHQTSVNDFGGKVVEILTDYQWEPDNDSADAVGGDGWLNTLEFIPEENKIEYRSYSPWLKRARTAPEHRFTIPYDMRVGRSR